MRYNSQTTRGGRFKPAQAVHESYSMPASVSGINALSSVTAMEPTDCIYCHNLVPSEYGLRLRKGYREWATGMTGGSVNTLIAFEGQSQVAVSERLWAVTADGIWDVSQQNEANPVQDVVFTVVGEGAGYGSYTEMSNDAGDRYLFYADELNGLHMYDESGDIWTVPIFTGIPLLDAVDVAYVMVWKNRLWFVQRNTGDAWYLDPGAIGGDATLFSFGSNLPHGGELKALFNWTVDGGNGVDDILVVVGGGGDILGYAGTDPETVATFSLVASYYIGQMPASRNVGLEYGGEMYMLSTYGVISIRQLLQGVLYQDPSVEPSAKINRFLRDAIDGGLDSYVWSMTLYPKDGFLQIIAPYETANRNNAVQYVQNTMTQAWGMWSDVPINCAATWGKRYLMGTPDGRVLEYFGGVDETKITPANKWENNPVIPLPTGPWTEPLPDEFNADGTQGAPTDLAFTSPVPPIVATEYLFRFTVSDYVDGSVALVFGDATTPFVAGNGTYTFTATNTASVLAEVIISGDTLFEGTVSNIYVGETTIPGVAINYDILTSFQPPGGNPTNYKKVGFVRPIQISTGNVNTNVRVIYDYDITALIDPPPSASGQLSSLWDDAIWDRSKWDYAAEANDFVRGTLGQGRVAAIAMRGSSSSRLTFVGWDVDFVQGGFL